MADQGDPRPENTGQNPIVVDPQVRAPVATDAFRLAQALNVVLCQWDFTDDAESAYGDQLYVWCMQTKLNLGILQKY